MKEVLETDIVICGAGPAGTTCALHLASKGISSLLIDKAIFPRDKICGDALSGNTIYELERLGIDITAQFDSFKEKSSTVGIKFQAPSGESLLLKMKKLRKGFSNAGYLSSRLHFDNFLFEECKKNSLIKIKEGIYIDEVITKDDKIHLTTKDKQVSIQAKMAIGADGAHSALAKITRTEIDKEHYSGGLRQYWENVKGFDEGAPIELHFYKEVLPGYLWIFPMKNNRANIGIAMRSDLISKKKINLKQTMDRLIKETLELKERFKDAKPLEEPKGFGLPLGSKRVPVSGHRFILLGDAASLIDPFTGEGIGNAMTSGRLGADHMEKCIKENNYSLEFNKEFDDALYKKLSPELRTSYRLQKLVTKSWMFNMIVRKANRNKHLHQFMEDILEDSNQRKQITKTSFYYKLIFNPKK